MTEREPIAVADDHDAWRERSGRVKARLKSGRETRFFRIISGVHALSAFAMIGSNVSVLLKTGSVRWPWWYSCLIAAAAILPAISGAAAWLWKQPPIKLYFLASASVITPLVLASYYRSPVLWLNVLVIGALIIFLIGRSRDNSVV